MKPKILNRMSQESSRRSADWWYQANTAGLAMSGVWGEVLLKPASRRDPVHPEGFPPQMPRLSCVRANP